MVRRWVLTCAVFLVLQSVASADGKFIPQPAYPAEPVIPAQRAIIVHKDGVETLIVESAFESDSPNVAWVLPLPAEPTKLEVADPGMIRSLAEGLQPHVVNDFGWWDHPAEAAWVLMVLAAAAIIFIKRVRLRLAVVLVLAVLWFVVLVLSGIGRGAKDSASDGSVPGVEELSSQRVGNYDVSVLKAVDANALSRWLKEKSFEELDSDEASAVTDYIGRKWCFVVAHLARDSGGAATPHPIAATFPSEMPVYPMKLTALAGSNTYVALFVIADEMASAPQFDCIMADRYGIEDDGWDSGRSQYYKARRIHMSITHPDVVELMWSGCAVSKLTAELSPEAMDHDVEIALEPVQSHRRLVYSERARREALYFNLQAAGFCGLLAVALAFRGMRRPRLWEMVAAAVVVVAGPLICGIIYAQMPTIPIIEGDRYGRRSRRDPELYTVEKAARKLIELGRLHAEMTDEELSKFPEMLLELENVTRVPLNVLTGEPIRYERTPGNFSVRRTPRFVFLCFHEGDWREYRMKLPPKVDTRQEEVQ